MPSPIGASGGRTPLGAGIRSPLGAGACCCICAPHLLLDVNMDSSFDGSCNAQGFNDEWTADPIDGEYRIPSVGRPSYSTRCEANNTFPAEARFPIDIQRHDYPDPGCEGTPTIDTWDGLAAIVHYSLDGHQEPGYAEPMEKDIILFCYLVAYATSGFPFSQPLFLYDAQYDVGFPHKFGDAIPNQGSVGTPYFGGDITIAKDW